MTANALTPAVSTAITNASAEAAGRSELHGFIAGFATGAFFWPVLIAVLIALTISVGKSRGGWSTVFFLVAAALVVIGAPAVIGWVVANPAVLVAIAVGYLAGGVLWARFKWSRFISERLAKFVSIRDNFLKLHGLTTAWFDIANLKTEHASSFVSSVNRAGFARFSVSAMDGDTIARNLPNVIPQASTNKADIVMWMMYWPLLIVWYILHDMLGDMFRGIYNRLAGHFQNVSNAAFKDVT